MRAAVAATALAFIAVGAVALSACEEGPPASKPVQTGGGDGGGAEVDANFLPPSEGGTASPRLVVVNALTETKGPFDGVVLCVNKMPAPIPATAMPLTNAPGIPAGGGVDLGAGLTGAVELHVFDAASIAGTKDDCGSLVFNNSPPLLSVTVPPFGTTVVALVTDTSKPKNLGVRLVTFGDTSSFRPDFVQAHFVNLSLVPAPITLTVDGVEAAQVTSNGSASSGFEIGSDPNGELVATHGAVSVTQSLQSVQYATDPTGTPDAFFGVRGSFVFALVGDPALPFDASAQAKDLTGRELHLIAVPYGDGVTAK